MAARSRLFVAVRLSWFHPYGGPERRVEETSGRVAWMPDGSALLVLQKTSTFGAQSVIRVWLATGQKQRLTFPKEIEVGTCSSAPTFPEALLFRSRARWRGRRQSGLTNNVGQV